MEAEDAPNIVPRDFPRRCGGALSGVHPKLSVTGVDGKFTALSTADELHCRYLACEELAGQLTDLARRKRPRYAELPLKDLLRRLRQGVLQKGWDLDSEELDWVMRRVCTAVGGAADDAPIARLSVQCQVLADSVLGQLPPMAFIESIVDRARRELAQGLPISQQPSVPHKMSAWKEQQESQRSSNAGRV